MGPNTDERWALRGPRGWQGKAVASRRTNASSRFVEAGSESIDPDTGTPVRAEPVPADTRVLDAARRYRYALPQVPASGFRARPAAPTHDPLLHGLSSLVPGPTAEAYVAGRVDLIGGTRRPSSR